MLAAMIVVFREAFEAGLIVGILLAVTRGLPSRGRWIGAGVGGGVAGACLVALFARTVTEAFAGVGQELLNAAVLALAAVMLTWHNVWMSLHGRALADDMRAAGMAAASGARSLASLAVVVAVAVLREGFEVVLFLYGVVAAESASGGVGVIGVLTGGVLGLLLAAGGCFAIYAGMVAIPVRLLFRTTTIMLALLAAGMAAQAMGFLEQANVVTALDSVLWDTSSVLSDRSLIGRALHTLVGYTDSPTALQGLAYALTLIVSIALIKTVRGRTPLEHA